MKRLWKHDCASQIVEFAVSLPLLIVIVVGIFDFSGAYTLKQKLANAARDGARAAAAGPATDLGNGGTPASVNDAFQVVDNYLKAENISDCGVNPSSATRFNLTWTYSASSTGPPRCSFRLDVNRGCVVNTNCSGPVTGTNSIGTRVSIQYAYNWRFNSVITLLVPGTSYTGTLTMNTSSIAFNEN